MKIILKKDVEKLGFKNEIVSVKDGYARNFLIPKGLAILATESARKILEENCSRRLQNVPSLRHMDYCCTCCYIAGWCVDNEKGMCRQTAYFLSAETTDVLAADTTDVLAADTTDVLSADTSLQSGKAPTPTPTEHEGFLHTEQFQPETPPKN